MYTQQKPHSAVNIPVNYGGTALLGEEPYIDPPDGEEAEPKEEPVRLPPPPSRPTAAPEPKPAEIPVFGPPPSEKDGGADGVSSIAGLLKLGRLKLPFLAGLIGGGDHERQRDICDVLLPALALLLIFSKEPDPLGGLMLLALLLIR